jgi:hypothetical protein
MYRYDAQDVIRAGPSSSADTVAVLRRDSLCFPTTGCEFSYGRMIEFDYEVPGWAILRFTADSSWVQVTLAPSDSSGPTGWVALGDSVRPLLWSQVLPTKQLFFMRPTDIAFFRTRGDRSPVAKDLAKRPRSDELSYIMTPLETRGAWLKVELLTPSPMCEFPAPKTVSDTLWIQHLTPERRPRVFWYTRGC